MENFPFKGYRPILMLKYCCEIFGRRPLSDGAMARYFFAVGYTDEDVLCRALAYVLANRTTFPLPTELQSIAKGMQDQAGLAGGVGA